MSLVHTESYQVASYLVNLRGQAGLYAILNFIQDVGWMHARELNISLPKNQGWVFTRQKLVMEDWPRWNQTVTIRTWLRPPSGAFVYRDYVISIGERQIGTCTSTFTVMDLQTRKLALQDWTGFAPLWNESERLEHLPEKIVWSAEARDLARFEVRNSDIDLNLHVNNTKYAQWVLDSLSLDNLREGAILQEYEVNFLAECKIGDQVVVRSPNPEAEIIAPTSLQFQGVRVRDEKPVFSARMLVAPAEARA